MSSQNNQEIERKWDVSGWPENLPCVMEQEMRQGYLSVRPTVRIREERTVTGEGAGSTAYVLCLKSAPHGSLTPGASYEGLSRTEIEMEIPQEKFAAIEEMIGLPLIEKTRRTYALPGGLLLEVNHVDQGLPTEFWYAEVEFSSEDAARAFDPEAFGLGSFLLRDVTDIPGESMGAFWEQTRLRLA